MFLQMALLLFAASVMFEGLIAYRISVYRHLMQKNEWLSVLVSMALSYFVGKIFGAQGLVCLLAGVMSTIASPFMYKSLNWYESNEGEITKTYHQIRQTIIDSFILFYKFLRLLTFPIRIVRAAKHAFAEDAK